MKRNEVKKAIRTVYGELWDILALYEKTGGFNEVPKEDEGTDIRDYMGEKLSHVRKTAGILFLGEHEISRKVFQIIDETEYFMSQHEIPGVVPRWKLLNPRLTYFDCAFSLMDKDPELFKQISRGQTEFSLSCYPDPELIRAREKYFRNIREKSSRHNLQYSEDRIFQDELLSTLRLLFEDSFQEYLHK